MKQSTVNHAQTGVDKLVTTAKEYIWPAFGRDSTFFDLPVSLISAGEGNYVIDSFGNRLLETNSCGAAASLGFNHPVLMEAMKKQMDKIVITTPNIFCTYRAGGLVFGETCPDITRQFEIYHLQQQWW